MKYCKYCDRHLPLDAFSARKASPDGLGYKCRECSSAYNKKRWISDANFRAMAVEKAGNWARANSEKRRSIVNAYDDRNRKEKLIRSRAGSKAFRENNPDLARLRGRIAAQKRRHREVAAGSAPQFNVVDRMLKIARSRCTYCESIVEKLTIDHFHPVSKGGDGTAWNLVPCCGPCNTSKKDRDGPAWIEKKFGIDRLIAVYWRIERLTAARLP